MVLVCLKRIHFYINKPLKFCVPMKLKHFTQLAKNTQKHLLFFSTPHMGGAYGNMASGNSTPVWGVELVGEAIK